MLVKYCPTQPRPAQAEPQPDPEQTQVDVEDSAVMSPEDEAVASLLQPEALPEPPEEVTVDMPEQTQHEP